MVQKGYSDAILMLDKFMAVVAETIKVSSDHSQRVATAVQDLIRQSLSSVKDLENVLDTTFRLCDGTYESKQRLAGSHSSVSVSLCSGKSRYRKYRFKIPCININNQHCGQIELGGFRK